MSDVRLLAVPALQRSIDRDRFELASPGIGWFERAHRDAAVVSPGETIGVLDTLGRRVRVVVPDGLEGVLTLPAVDDPRHRKYSLPRTPVEYGELLGLLDAGAPDIASHRPSSSAAASQAGDAGLVFRAPTSGRYYSRPSPDKPAFVSVGDELAAGSTVCLLEVMKTFHRVTYGGPGLPERAKVRALLVADGDDVNVGDPLLALE